MCSGSENIEQVFCFSEWAERFELSRATTGILSKEGCTTLEVLKFLTPTAVNKLCLSIGQGIAFRRGLKALGNTVGGKQLDAWSNSPTNEGSKRLDVDAQSTDSHLPSGQHLSTSDVEEEAEHALDAYLKGGQTKGTETTPRGIKKLYRGDYGQDPRLNLVIKSLKKKAHKIISFVPDAVAKRVATKARDKMALIPGPDGKLVVRADEDQPAYITLAEWGAANLRLMQHLLDTGELARSEIEFYNAYTLMIFEYIEHYEWPSVIAFDSRYRELQAHAGFPWGTPNRGLEVSALTPRVKKDKAAERGRNKGPQRGEKRALVGPLPRRECVRMGIDAYSRIKPLDWSQQKTMGPQLRPRRTGSESLGGGAAFGLPREAVPPRWY